MRHCKTGCNSSNTDTYPTDLVEKEDVPEYLVEVVQTLQVLQVLADVEDVEQFLHSSSPSSIMHAFQQGCGSALVDPDPAFFLIADPVPNPEC
jgi:hypothetical protein